MWSDRVKENYNFKVFFSKCTVRLLICGKLNRGLESVGTRKY